MGRFTQKYADAIGSGTADPSTASARTVPVPQLAVENKPAPGQRGPAGLGGRTTYSRVNTGTPPVPDMGTTAQKSQEPRGLEFLPKTASQENEIMATTTTMGRPSLQTLIKSAMAGAATRVDVSLEAARQLVNAGVETPKTKVASAQNKQPFSPSIPTDVTTKLASALDYVARQLNPKLAEIDLDSDTSDGVGPGEGPGSLEVTYARASGENIDAGELGSANLQPPKDPSTQKDPTRPADPSTGLETNDGPGAGKQPVEPISNEKTTLSNDEVKAASAQLNNLLALGLAKVAFDQRGQLVIEKVAFGNPLQGVAGANTAAGTAGGALSGGLGGAALGGLAGAAVGKLTGIGAGTGAKWGAGLGGAAGAGYGGYKGNQAAQGSALNQTSNAFGKAAAAAPKERASERAGRRLGGLAGGIAGTVAGAKGGDKLVKALGGGRTGRTIGALSGGFIGGGAGRHIGSRLGRAAGGAVEKGLDTVDPKGKKEASIKEAAAAMVRMVKAAEGEAIVPQISDEDDRRAILGISGGLGGLGGLAAGGGDLGGTLAGVLGGQALGGAALGAREGGLGGAVRGLTGATAGSVLGGGLGALGGGAVGAGLGGLGGAGIGGIAGGIRSRSLEGARAGAQKGGLIGAGLGGLTGLSIGGGAGMVEGAGTGYELAQQGLRSDQRVRQAMADAAAATEANKTASVLARNLMVLGLYKQAEDAINPAQISAGKIDDIGDKSPDGAVGSGEGAPAEPSDVNSQKKKMVSSNEAAINYTKRDAKADPKGDLGDVLNEPALSASTDATLDKTLEHTDAAGAKVSSVRQSLSKVSAARATLSKIAQAHGVQQGKKEKKATMGGAPSTPQAASGFTAGTGM